MADSQTWNGGIEGSKSPGHTPATNGTDGPMAGIRDKAASMANEQKDRAADGLGGIADVARHTSDELRGQSELLASWVNIASDQLRTLADRLRDKQPGELAEDVTRFARQRPLLFIGGAFLLGMGLARIPKNSPAAKRALKELMPESLSASKASPMGGSKPMGGDKASSMGGSKPGGDKTSSMGDNRKGNGSATSTTGV